MNKINNNNGQSAFANIGNSNNSFFNSNNQNFQFSNNNNIFNPVKTNVGNKDIDNNNYF